MQTEPNWSSIEDTQPSDIACALIDVAGRRFAQKGYHKVSVREICSEAGANMAAVNYYFGNKKKLFFQVLKTAFETVQQDEADAYSPLDAHASLQLFIERTLEHIMREDAPSWHQTLMLRVMHEDPELFQEAMHTVIRYEYETLSSIISSLTKGAVKGDALQLTCFSILGQCLFYHHNRMLVSIIAPKWLDENARIKRLSEHIFAFSLAAIKA